MATKLVLNGRWSGYFVKDGVPQKAFHIKNIVEFVAKAEASGVEVIQKAKTVQRMLAGRTDPAPDGMAIGYKVVLKTKSKEFGDDLAAAIKYRDRYQGELVEVAL